MAVTKKWSALKAHGKSASPKTKSKCTAMHKDKCKTNSSSSTKKKDSKRASKKSDSTTILKKTTITSEITKETYRKESRAMLHVLLRDAREAESLYKDMIDQLYALMTQAERAKECAVGQQDWEKKSEACREITSQYNEAKSKYNWKSMEVLCIRQSLDTKQMLINSYFHPRAARAIPVDVVSADAGDAEQDGEDGEEGAV